MTWPMMTPPGAGRSLAGPSVLAAVAGVPVTAWNGSAVPGSAVRSIKYVPRVAGHHLDLDIARARRA
jgi:hypothetical protein